MKKGKFLAISYILSMAAAMMLLSPVEAAEHSGSKEAGMDRTVAIVNHHDARAKFHEDTALEMQARAREQKRLLERYETKSYLYGRRAQDLQAHTDALIRKLDRSAKEHVREAALHRRMAVQCAENAFCAPNPKAELC